MVNNKCQHVCVCVCWLNGSKSKFFFFYFSFFEKVYNFDGYRNSNRRPSSTTITSLKQLWKEEKKIRAPKKKQTFFSLFKVGHFFRISVSFEDNVCLWPCGPFRLSNSNRDRRLLAKKKVFFFLLLQYNVYDIFFIVYMNNVYSGNHSKFLIKKEKNRENPLKLKGINENENFFFWNNKDKFP